MSTKLKPPLLTQPIIESDGSATKRLYRFFDGIPGIADTQTPLTITWTSNEPIASTNQTVANGSAVTSTEVGQFMKNVNTVLTSLINELKAAGVING